MDNETNRQEEIDIFELLYLFLSKWKWIVFSVFVVLFLSWIYLKKTTPVYNRTATVMIKNDSKGNQISSDFGSTISDMGFFQSNVNVKNEIFAFKSPATILETVVQLGLDKDYLEYGFWRSYLLYGETLPIVADIKGVNDEETISFTLKVSGNQVELSDFNGYKDNEWHSDKVVKGPLDKALKAGFATITIKPTANYRASEKYPPIFVHKKALHATVEDYAKRLEVTLADKDASVLNLSLDDLSSRRAEDFLNTLILVYNAKWIADKNQLALSTSAFIDIRLDSIKRELNRVDNEISSFKSKNLIPNVDAVSKLYLSQSTDASNKILALNTQLSIVHYICNYLHSSSKFQLLPANVGIDNSDLNNQISNYNTLLLQRNSMVENSSKNNPLVVEMDHSLSSMNKNIISSLDNLLISIKTQIKNLENNESQNQIHIAENPTQEKYLLSIERQQKVKEALYLFLLQKREENSLTQAFTAYNTRVITPPYGRLKPVSPQKKRVFVVALVLGLFFPMAILLLINFLDTSVHTRKDLENVTIPYLGQIPLAYTKNRLKSNKHEEMEMKKHKIYVEDKNNDFINEAFRMVRTNLSFMKKPDGEPSKVVMVTSARTNSGKTFVTINLSTSFAIKGNKVLAIDLDMRKAALSHYIDSPKNGISNYLSGFENDLSHIIVKNAIHERLDIIPVGIIPPNPTELLVSQRFTDMIQQLKDMYDCIFIDCPPIEVVADTAIINNVADITLFVIRSGLFDRRILPHVEMLHQKKVYNNLAIVLNGIKSEDYRYGYYRYKNYGYGGYEYVHKKDTRSP